MFFCGIFFSWSLLYYDSCPLPVKITSPGTHSSSRAHGLQANTSSPGLSTTVHCTNVHVHVYAWHYKAIKERLLLLPDNSFPFVFLFSVCSLRPLQFLCVSWNPGNVASSQCCCVLDQELLVLEWGGARLSSQERRRLARPLHSDSLPEHTQIRGKKGE